MKTTEKTSNEKVELKAALQTKKLIDEFIDSYIQRGKMKIEDKVKLFHKIRNSLIRAENPERYGVLSGNDLILCQIDDESDRVIITKTKAFSGRSKNSAETLYDGEIEDFCYDYDGEIEFGGLDCEQAFCNWLMSNII